ncbi:MAG: hypothetical protein DI526_08640 [Caulobacter segnis]|uniref:Uncharacterized protein n=1 Tax=Caulobacter segnis TaxID=88688 RepID=A0A2W5V8N2_9CAUL|nr:MAG: hypothetical protein DI526_08640 [Caulobacter segnis]
MLAFANSGPLPSVPTGAEAPGWLAFAEVCLKSVVEGRPIEDLAKAAGMLPVSSGALGGTAKDRAWRLGLLKPSYVVAWTDGGCTAIVEQGDAAALGEMARAAILARPERFRPGLSGLFDGDRVQRDVYCAERNGRWTLATITVPGPQANKRTRALSSSVYARPTPSLLCQAR